MEGFPRTAEEARYLAEAGFYPDCVINFAAEENDIVDRLLPPLLNKWKIKRDKRLAKKQRQLEIKLKKRVRNYMNDTRFINEFRLELIIIIIVIIIISIIILELTIGYENAGSCYWS